MTRSNLRWGVLQHPDLYADADWNPVFNELRDQVIEHGHREVIAPDGDADFVWTETGAQPFSLWLPGSIKLGFDPKPETGLSYVQRVRTSEAAFREGLEGLCQLAHRRDAALVLRHDGSLLGTHDVRPSAKYRVDPKHRVADSLNRTVAPFTIYEDRNSSEALVLTPGAVLPVGFSGPGIRLLDVLLEPRYPDVFANPRLTLQLPDGTAIQPTQERLARNSIRLRYQLPDGLARRIDARGAGPGEHRADDRLRAGARFPWRAAPVPSSWTRRRSAPVAEPTLRTLGTTL